MTSTSSAVHRVLGLAFVSLGGCTLVSGVDEFRFGSSGVGGGAAASSSAGQLDTSSASLASTGASCPLETPKECSGICVAIDDPALGCDGSTCTACPAGSSCCPSCTDTTVDPHRCGSCSHPCADDEWCTASHCDCRPGLVIFDGVCVDPDTNPGACGGGAACTGGTPLCDGGSCVATCSSGKQSCGGSCVDTTTDELHCGGCDSTCHAGEFCLGHDCIPFTPAPECSSCPCDSCGGSHPRCCNYPGSAAIVCVGEDAQGCP